MHSPESRQEVACYNYVTSLNKKAALKLKGRLFTKRTGDTLR